MRPRNHTLALALWIGACGGQVAGTGPIGDEIRDPDATAPPVITIPVEIDGGLVEPGPQPEPEPTIDPAPAVRRAPAPIECAMLRNGHLDTWTLPGARRRTGPAVALDTFDITSMGQLGNALYACSSTGGDGVVVQIARTDATVVRSNVPCVAATADRYGIEVLQRDPQRSVLVHFSDWGHVLDGTPRSSHDYERNVTRIAPFFDQIVGAWHISRTVTVTARADGAFVAQRTLDRPASNLDGLALVPDGRLVIGSPAGALDVFDPFEGSWLERHGGDAVTAIACQESTEPRLDSCDGRDDGLYCSEHDYLAAYECTSGAQTKSAQCLGGTCQTGNDGHAWLQDERLQCSPLARPIP